ncbi:unnamed protein product [Parnassius apollo]|uniref:(apollo) hypothetical protein n=1 Tax=Parnassius apollo TaxID=110799 RepID=A0A8S3X9M0_PARAO|nr:unnamed protein product [Parnassius apollo]
MSSETAPTTLARQLLSKDHVVAEADGPILMVWGCNVVNEWEFVSSPLCHLHPKINYWIAEDPSSNHTGYYEPVTEEILDKSPVVPCRPSMGKPIKRRNRRVLGSRPYKNYSEEMLHLAVENAKENGMSSRTAEKTFGIPRRTILNKVKECHNKNVGTPTRLSFQEEKSIVQALIAAGEYGCPLTKLDLRLTVFEYLKKNNRENLFHGKPPDKDWVTSFLRHAEGLSGKKVVICDNLSSHLSLGVTELCQDHNTYFVFIPPNSTHLTQPLDVAFFAPLKKAWRKILLQYKMENPNQKAINKNYFPKLLTQLIKTIEMNEVQNIKSGFRATGIYPFNPREVLKRIPECAEEMGNAHNIDSALLEYLKTTRQSKPLTSDRNRKVVIEPGKSVTVDDIQNRTKDTKKRPAKNKSALIKSTAVQKAKNQILNDTPSTASVGKENKILDQFKDEL